MKPIPLMILNQSATHKRVTKDNWGAETTVDYTLTNVYFEPSNNIVKSKDNTEVVSSGIMVFDIVNSVNKLVDVVSLPVFNYDDIIVFDSKEYRIIKVDPIYQANTTDIHHYEIYLR